MQTWKQHHPRGLEMAGFIPLFVNPNDPRPAREQLDENYAHGGGWFPMNGWSLLPGDRIRFEDETYMPVCSLTLKGERVVVYQHAWVAIIQDDGKFEVARMD